MMIFSYLIDLVSAPLVVPVILAYIATPIIQPAAEIVTSTATIIGEIAFASAGEEMSFVGNAEPLLGAGETINMGFAGAPPVIARAAMDFGAAFQGAATFSMVDTVFFEPIEIPAVQIPAVEIPAIAAIGESSGGELFASNFGLGDSSILCSLMFCDNYFRL